MHIKIGTFKITEADVVMCNYANAIFSSPILTAENFFVNKIWNGMNINITPINMYRRKYFAGIFFLFFFKIFLFLFFLFYWYK